MRNPPRKAAIFTGLMALGAALGWLGVQRHGARGEDWVSGVMIAAAFAIVPVMLVFLVQALFHMRGMAKLRAGTGRLAQWHVSAADWDKYRASEGTRTAVDPRFLGNDLWVRGVTPPEGVDVIVGEKSLIVDNSYHVLRMNGLPELRGIGWLDNSSTPGRPPDCIEFLLAYPRGKYGGIQHTTLRVPVPEAAQVPARKAYLHFAPALERRQAKGPIALRNPRRTLQVCGVILVASLAAIAWARSAAEATGWSVNETMAPMVTMIVGAVLALFAVVLGLLTLLLRPKPGD
jgi:hypothetical protein